MKHQGRDKSLDTLLDLDGEIIVVDPLGKHWVRFSVTKVEPTPEKPHGLDYSLTLHAEDGERLVGFDDAHQVSPTEAQEPGRERHRIIGIAFGQSDPTTTRMPLRSWRTSGLRSMRY